MKIKARSMVKSSHDLILVVGALLALAMIVSEMVHNWRHLPAGSYGATTVTENRLAAR
ncbi:MAG TPA: hypothetical protein VGR40_09835 [Candidatus Binatus sp.]|nr:hypothetical protein [Candidatus Binatus sp.]